MKTRGIPFEAPAVTLLVNKHGAKVRTTMHMQVGTYVRITNPATNRAQLARVAWVGKSDDTIARLAFGIELLDPENFWGVYLPPADWVEAQSWQEEEDEASQMPRPFRPEPVPGGVRSSGDSLFRSSEAPPNLPPLEIPEEGVDVLVRGISGALIPFQESSVLHPVDEKEATVLLRPVVDFGKFVQVIFPLINRIVRARISGVSEQRAGAKWKTWIRFAHPFRILKGQEPPASP